MPCRSSPGLRIGTMLLLLSYILVPMDETQTDHLRAYGVIYWAISRGYEVDWLLNYRGGSFLIYSNAPDITRTAAARGVYYERIGESKRAEIEAEIENSNMAKVRLLSLPKLAVYAPKYAEPWDDAVRMALDYAKIPYDLIWDGDILEGALKRYDWVHLLAVAKRIKRFVADGGYLFAMCSAPLTLDAALASEGVDILDVPFDGDPPDPNANSKLDYSKTLFATNFRIITNPYIYEHTDADATRDIAFLGPNAKFKLYEFAAKVDEIPTMLTQNHTHAIKEFLGQDSGVYLDKLKKYVVVLAVQPGANAAKYVYAQYGRGFFSFYFGHDPEDYQHFVGEEPTDLSKHKHSPGYRLILNNIFLPSAKKKKKKT